MYITLRDKFARPLTAKTSSGSLRNDLKPLIEEQIILENLYCYLITRAAQEKVVKVKFDERQALRQLQQYGYHGITFWKFDFQFSLVLYGRPFVSKLWHDIRAVFSHVHLQSFLLRDIRAFFCHVYLRFIPKYMTIFLQTRIYMRTKKSPYTCVTNNMYVESQKVAGADPGGGCRGCAPPPPLGWPAAAF